MNRKKQLGISSLILLFGMTIWYLGIKPHDFEVVMYANTSPGTVYHNVLGWNKALNKGEVLTELFKKSPFRHIVHSYDFDTYRLMMEWKIDNVNDSVTKVSIGIDHPGHSVRERIAKLFGTSPLEALIEQEFSGFNTVLVNHLNNFKVEIEGQEEAPEAYVAYVPISCNQEEKALYMIKNSTYINSFLQANGIKLASHPFLEIEDWDIQTGELTFNFCFPIGQGVDLPYHQEIKYKKVSAKKSVKATFHGNYSFTEEAWFALHQYTQDKQLIAHKTITEVFYENPHTVAKKDIDWQASVYMEIE